MRAGRAAGDPCSVMRSRIVLLVTTLAALALPASAPGYVLDEGTGPFTNPPVGGLRATVPITGSAAGIPLLRDLWQASVRYWGGVPASCVGGIVVNLSTDDPDDDPTDTETSAWVYEEEPCVLYLNAHNTEWPITRRTALTWCTVITHEAGHMHGLDHSRDRRNIMYGGWIPWASPECNRFSTDGKIHLPKLDDPYYDQQGRRRSTAERLAYERERARRGTRR